MTPEQALSLLTAATEMLHPDFRLTLETQTGQPVLVTAQSRMLHQSIAEAVKVLNEAITPKVSDAQQE